MIEKKLNVSLFALESLIMNDTNLELALENNILQIIVKLIRGIPLRGPSATNQTRGFFKFALRCLTSAIRTEPSVIRVSDTHSQNHTYSSTDSKAVSQRSSK